MKLSVIGSIPPKGGHCWQAIAKSIHSWESDVEAASLEARFAEDSESLILLMLAPGREPARAEVDVAWIAYADQAERLSMLAMKAVRDMESQMLNPGVEDSSVVSQSSGDIR
jgi:hypothetical protein